MKISKIRACAYVILAAIMLIVIFEVLSWLAFFLIKKPEYAYHSSYMNGYIYHPYIGFRTSHYPIYGDIAKSDSSAIYITGGSTAAGVGVSDLEKKYFKLLEDNLIKDKVIKDKQIVNLAVPGFVSNQEAAVYKNYIFNLPVAPKVVLSFTSFNDIYFYLFRTLEVGSHEFSYEIDLVFRKGYPPPDSDVEKIRNFVRATNLYKLVYSIVNKRADGAMPPILLSSNIFNPYQSKHEPVDISIIKKAANNFLENCLSTALLAKHRGTKFVVMLQPTYYYGGELTVKQNEWFDEMTKLNRWIQDVGMQKKAYDKFYDLVLAGLQNYKRQGLLDYLDYRDKLKSAGPVYLDPVHYNERGSELLAKFLSEDLKKTIKHRN